MTEEQKSVSFMVFEKETGNVVKITDSEQEAISYVLKGNYNYQWIRGGEK